MCGAVGVHFALSAREVAVSTQRSDQRDKPRLPTGEEVLSRGRPFPPYEEMVIDGLTDDEEEDFLKAIAEA